MAQPPRIVAGAARGRRLVVPPGETVRPTKDRVKAAVFSALDARGLIQDAVVLDAFAGSGALGLEALSRGAVHATFVERDRHAVAAIRHNVEAFGFAHAARILTGDVGSLLAASALTFDLAFVDPPYSLTGPAFDDALATVARCTPGGTIVVERPAGWSLPQGLGPGLQYAWERKFGDTLVVFLNPDS